MTAEELEIIITAQNREFNTAINGVINRLDDMEERTRHYGDSATDVFKRVAQAASALGIGKIISDSIMSGGELEQNLGGVEVVFRQHAESMKNTAKTAFKDMGLSESGYLAAANKMGALLKGSGFDIASAADMSQQVMQRASDVASIMGIDVASAMEAVTGAAKGNFTMMDNLGVAINDTTLQIYAQEKGLGKLETTQQKVSAAMQMFLEKTEYAAGNYARENDTFSGSLTTFRAELQNLSAELGTELLPTATSLLSMARSGLEAVSPLVITLGEGVNRVAAFLTGLSPTAKTMLTISLLSAVAIPAVTQAMFKYNAVIEAQKRKLDGLTAKQLRWNKALKTSLGWLMVLMAVLSIVADIGATAREMKAGEDMQDTADGADAASASVDGLADSYAGLGDSADSAKKSLLDIDTLNVFDGSSAGTAGMDFTAAVDGANSAQEAFDEAMNAAGDMEDELNGLSLDGLGDTFSTTFSDIGTGFATLLDAFNFDSDTQLESLRVLDKKVRGLFGDEWSDFWTNVGSTMYRAFGENNSEYDRYMALTDIEGWLTEINNFLTGWMGDFGTAWTDFWKGIGSSFNESNNNREIELSNKFSTLYADINDALIEYLKQGMDPEEALKAAKDKNKVGNNWDSLENQYFNEQDWGERLNFTYAYELQQLLKQSGQINPAADASQYRFVDYTAPSGVLSGYQPGSSPDWSKIYSQTEDNSVRSYKFEIPVTVELDGDKIGESVTNYQTRENAKSNGY